MKFNPSIARTRTRKRIVASFAMAAMSVALVTITSATASATDPASFGNNGNQSDQLPLLATNPDFNHDTCPAGPAGTDAWHFVAPDSANFFIHLEATFAENADGTGDTVILDLTDAVQKPSTKHAYLYAPTGWYLVGVTGGTDSPTSEFFVLSHTCPGTPADEPAAPEITVTKTADPFWERTHDWTLDKERLSITPVMVGGVITGANVSYQVTTIETIANTYSVSGEITIANANDTPATIDSLTDNLPGFGDCTVEAGAVGAVVTSASAMTVKYECPDLTELPAGDLTNTASASWSWDDGSDSGTGTAPVVFPAAPDADVHAAPILTDDKYSGVVAGTPYTIFVGLSAANCAGFTNIATLTGDNEMVLDTDSVTTRVCSTIGGRTIGFWSNKNGAAAVGTHWTTVKALYPNVIGSLSTNFATIQKFLVASTTNCTGTCTTMLQAQFIATALNSQYIAGYASEQVTVPTYIDPDGCATVTELLAAINSQWSGLTTAQRIELKSVLDRLNQDQPNQLQCGMN